MAAYGRISYHKLAYAKLQVEERQRIISAQYPHNAFGQFWAVGWVDHGTGFKVPAQFPDT